MNRQLPTGITSYDLLKSCAVIIMIIDHIGWYFFPDELWWRAIGRIGFPVWFFLIGHASGRHLGWKLWGGALLLLAANFVAGAYIFPLNALFTIILIRLAIDPLMRLALYNKAMLFCVAVILLAAIIPTSVYVEYGTQAVIMAMFGYMVRNRDRLNLSREFLSVFAGFAFVSFILLQDLQFSFARPQLIFMAAGTLLVIAVLYVFNAREYQELTRKLPGFAVAAIQFGGRRTLEIYVAHLLAFKMLGMVLDPARYGFMQWTVFYSG